MFGFDLLAIGGPAGEVALGVGGAAAAILLLGGPIVLRAQRQRQQFLLAKAAIERGAVLPLESPAWLQSMRAAILTLTLGLALLVTGVSACWLGSGATMPSATTRPGEIAALQIPGFPQVRPPRPDPVDERWHEARAEKTIGLTAIGCGVILSMLGIARLGFARVERRYEAGLPAVPVRE